MKGAYVPKKVAGPFIRKMLFSNDEWAKKGLLLLFGYQTEDEVNKAESIYRNKRGFGKGDDQRLTPIATKIVNGEEVTETEMTLVKSRLPIYWKQVYKACDQLKLSRHIIEFGESVEAIPDPAGSAGFQIPETTDPE